MKFNKMGVIVFLKTTAIFPLILMNYLRNGRTATSIKLYLKVTTFTVVEMAY